jgi:hypothetical protein
LACTPGDNLITRPQSQGAFLGERLSIEGPAGWWTIHDPNVLLLAGAVLRENEGEQDCSSDFHDDTLCRIGGYASRSTSA